MVNEYWALIRRRVQFAGAAFVLVTAANAQSRPASSAPTVTINAMSYGQLPADLKVGDTITWVNRDTVPHTVTARDHSFDLRLQPGRSGRVLLRKAGNIPFYCLYHTMMRGALNVAA